MSLAFSAQRFSTPRQVHRIFKNNILVCPRPDPGELNMEQITYCNGQAIHGQPRNFGLTKTNILAPRRTLVQRAGKLSSAPSRPKLITKAHTTFSSQAAGVGRKQPVPGRCAHTTATGRHKKNLQNGRKLYNLYEAAANKNCPPPALLKI